MTIQGALPNSSHWRRHGRGRGVFAVGRGRIWPGVGFKRHLSRGFKALNTPMFQVKVIEVVGPYLDWPDRAVLMCVDDKSQIPALDWTQPGLPLMKSRAATMTHDMQPDHLWTWPRVG